MYFLYSLFIATIGLIVFRYIKKNIKNTKSTKSTKSTKKFDDIDEYNFNLENIEFYKDNLLIKQKNYDKKEKLEININDTYDFIIVNYKYNNKSYKFYTTNNNIKFPFYSEDQIINYVYINQITKAMLEIYYNNDNDKKETTHINILNYILPYLGPNYNFYEDLDVKIYLNDIIYLILPNNDSIKEKIDLNKKNYTLKLYDKFNNEYSFVNDYLIWVPKLKL